MTRRAYGCRLNRPAAVHPAELLKADLKTVGISAEALAERSGMTFSSLEELLQGDRLPTLGESKRITPFLGREKQYYHKRAIEWKDENA